MNDDFERVGPVRRAIKRALIDPLANYLPAGLLRGMLRFGKSEMAAANWADPGGWRSMVISYEGQCKQIADRILVSSGVMAMALRNRRRLASRLLAEMIDGFGRPVHVLCLGAGPGMIIIDAMSAANSHSRATLVDLSSDAFQFGQNLAGKRGLADRVRYIRGDVRNVQTMLDEPPDIVKMIGICEYIPDEPLLEIASAVARAMPERAPIVFNNLTFRHGNDRFFRRVFGLHMIHRSVGQLCGLMSQAGFGDFQVHEEPLGVYSVIIGRKVGQAVRHG